MPSKDGICKYYKAVFTILMRHQWLTAQGNLFKNQFTAGNEWL